VRPELLAVALVAAGALAFEVLLTRLLAIVHWHHFAGMVISLALLGYGASGAFLAPLLERLRPHAPLAFAGAATLFGVAAAAAAALDRPPLKWSVPRYGFEPEEDRDGEQEAPA
jgi:hypothetical protein